MAEACSVAHSGGRCFGKLMQTAGNLIWLPVVRAAGSFVGMASTAFPIRISCRLLASGYVDCRSCNLEWIGYGNGHDMASLWY